MLTVVPVGNGALLIGVARGLDGQGALGVVSQVVATLTPAFRSASGSAVTPEDFAQEALIRITGSASRRFRRRAGARVVRSACGPRP